MATASSTSVVTDVVTTAGTIDTGGGGGGGGAGGGGLALVETWIDEDNVTQYIQSGQVTHRLNRPATCEITFPSQSYAISDNSRIRIYLNGELDFHGTVEGDSAIEIDGDVDPDSIITKAQAIDPLVFLDTRRAMDADGDYTDPTFLTDFTTGPQIIQHLLQNTIFTVGILPFSPGAFETGGANIGGAPKNWPMMISEVMILLTETGECDIEMVPYDGGASTMGVLNAYNGDMGNDLTGSVNFDYQTGDYNCTKCRMTVDKSTLANRIRYLLGPRGDQYGTAAVEDDQHWDGSIDRTTTAQLPAGWLSVGEPARDASEDTYGIREDTRIIDAVGDSNMTLDRDLYLYQWSREAWIRLKPKLMLHITPQPGTLPTFKVGDLIMVSAGSAFNGGISGEQRVMEYTYTWNEDGVVELGAPAGQAGAAAVTVTDMAEGLDL